jgi:hypothetical protein
MEGVRHNLEVHGADTNQAKAKLFLGALWPGKLILLMTRDASRLH